MAIMRFGAAPRLPALGGPDCHEVLDTAAQVMVLVHGPQYSGERTVYE
jgi:hypothetical protein